MPLTGWDTWTRLWASGMRLVDTGRKLAEVAQASSEVVESRVRTIAAAAGDPMSGDYVELGRMVPEKVDAFGRAGTSVFSDLMTIQSAAIVNAQQFTALALTGRAPTMAEAEAMWARSCGIVMQAMDVGGRALAPLHQRVTANARRLRKTRAA